MIKSNLSVDADKMQEALLDWYNDFGRQLPWRQRLGVVDPYKIWLSEIMLQQTTVATVKGYFEKFLRLWPTLESLSRASQDDVLHAWQGLGYYSRARNLHKCAKVLISDYGGVFPESEAQLLKLPGIGPYTAAAIMSIAFNKPAVIVDGNVERVISRIFCIETFLPEAKPEIKEHAAILSSQSFPADYSSAIMDLGATVCTPRKPKCGLCPWSDECAAYKNNVAERYPRKRRKSKVPRKKGIVYWVENDAGQVFIQKRPEKGLLAGLMEIPWAEQEGKEISFPFISDWQKIPGEVDHVFTHFHLKLKIYRTVSNEFSTGEGVWCAPENFENHAFPTLMKKVIQLAAVAPEKV